MLTFLENSLKIPQTKQKDEIGHQQPPLFSSLTLYLMALRPFDTLSERQY